MATYNDVSQILRKRRIGTRPCVGFSKPNKGVEIADGARPL
jgi:hypothetical protein